MRTPDRLLVPSLLLLLAVAPACSDPPVTGTGSAAVAEAVAGSDAPPPTASAPGEGFVVWESNRTGAWRLWTRRLDGSGLRQLTPDEPGRQHYAPHISPDGRQVAYLSAVDAGRSYPADGVGLIGELRLIPAAGGDARVLVERARSHFENRSVVWRSDEQLIFMGEDLRTYLLELASGRTRALTAEPPAEQSWLVDATLRHASTNAASFSLYDAERRRIVPRAELGGCQPYFTHDGRWGVWTAGAGGPLEKMDLGSRRIGRLLAKNDPRLPDGLGYLYFPMPSRDSRLLAFAASRNQHDHFRSDYEVFVVETDPATLEPIGVPIRYTRHPATDRYPDVFLEPLELGLHRGEAPFEVTLAAPGGGDWRWSLGDGGEAGGGSVRHRYRRPGRYRVEAVRQGERLRGQVVVTAAAAPRVVVHRLSGDARELWVELDEPVRDAGATVAFASGRAVAGRRLEDGGRRLVVELTEPLQGTDRLTLAGLEDRASPANRMAETVLEVGPPLWPASRDGLVFAWQTGDSPNLVPDPEGGPDRAVTLRATGLARLDHHWAMLPAGGRFEASAEDAARVKTALQLANELSVQLTVTVGETVEGVPLVSFADDRRQNFALARGGGELTFYLKTGPPRVPLAQAALPDLVPGRPNHLVVSYSPGRLTLYLDGERRAELGAETIIGDFYHWGFPLLSFGGGGDRELRIEGVAIYDRVLGAEEARAEFERYRAQLAGRPAVPQTVVEARLRRRSPAPGLEEISPYREGLVVFEYEVLRPAGKVQAPRIRVAHWAILDGQRQPLVDRAEGSVTTLRLEPFDANPQLASLFLGEAAEIDPGLPLYYAPDP